MLISRELRGESADCHFEISRNRVRVVREPHLLDQLGVSFGDLTTHSQRVVEIQLGDKVFVEDVLRQQRNVAQALNREWGEGGRVRKRECIAKSTSRGGGS